MNFAKLTAQVHCIQSEPCFAFLLTADLQIKDEYLSQQALIYFNGDSD
jgi:hypothetical protein